MAANDSPGTTPAQPSSSATTGAVKALLETLGVDLDREFLVLALTHRSFAHEAGGVPTNERLEFLGDSVVGLVVTEYIYRTLPGHSEGELARIRAATVSQAALAQVARTIGLGELVLLGKGEAKSGGAEKDSILCDTFEALMGAIYLTHGYDTTEDTILRLLRASLDHAASAGVALDWKTSIQELAAAHDQEHPRYEVSGEGPDHDRSYTARLYLGQTLFGEGTGRNKKVAEQQAAERAYESLSQYLETTDEVDA